MSDKPTIEQLLNNVSIESLNEMQEDSLAANAKASDVILLSPTGSGKTLGFLLPVFEKLSVSSTSIQALVLVPSRELALQIQTRKESVIIIENDEKKVDQLLKEGLYVIQSDASNEKTYSNISINNIKSLITTSEDDWQNLRVCQIVKKLKPDIETISIINDIKSNSVFENLGIKTVNIKEAIISAVKGIYKQAQ